METVLTAADGTKAIAIGRQGESGVYEIAYDCTAWLAQWPGGTIAVTYLAPDGTEPTLLPPSQYGLTDGTLGIRVLANMTALPGFGSVVIRLAEAPDVTRKSAVIGTCVEESHAAATGETPEPVSDWIADATAKLAEVEALVPLWGAVDIAATGLAAETAFRTAVQAGVEARRRSDVASLCFISNGAV